VILAVGVIVTVEVTDGVAAGVDDGVNVGVTLTVEVTDGVGV
jgi:hypothetical protein